MSLPAGSQFGPYQIIAPLGSGGMGQVFRARDSRLRRDVAIKILSAPLAPDADRLARFEREAQVLASLHHPNIAAIYGVEESGGVTGLVLELVEGQTLAERLARGPMPLDEALAAARQVADALEAAHDAGIVHRDLKPANIKLTPDGTAKVLDFGLAKLAQPGDGHLAPGASASATAASFTSEGILVGTVAYMSPEQARGLPVDKRTDIWAFGCVVYEMLSGRTAFGDNNVSETLAAILTAAPDWSALESRAPDPVRTLLRRCLEKDRKRRLAHIADARLELDDAAAALQNPAARRTVAPDASTISRIGRRWRLVGGALVLGAAAILLLTRWAPGRGAPEGAVRVSVELGASVSLATAQGPALALSHDGSILAFVGQPIDGSAPQQIYVRQLGELTARPLPGSAGGMGPSFSPDGRSLAFFGGGKLKRVALSGGAPIALADAPNGRGVSWGDDDTLLYMPDFYAGIWRVSADGGEPVRVTTLAGEEVTHRWPQFLPGGKAVLYTSHTRLFGYEDATVVVQPLPSGTPRAIVRGGYHGQYIPTGHIVFMRQGSLSAMPFDVDRLERGGEPVPVLHGVAGGAFLTGAAQFAAAKNGTVAYIPAGHDAAPLHWVDRAGRISLLRSRPTNWTNASFAPDGQSLALDVADGNQSDLWVYDLAAGALTRLTFDRGDDFKPIFTPDGTRIAFSSTRGNGVLNLYWQRSDGTGTAERLTDSAYGQAPASWHPSGRYLAYVELTASTSFDVKVLALDPAGDAGSTPGSPMTLLGGAAVETEPMFSPDGQWLAYASNESGRFEVYVRRFPGSGGTWQISTDGGTFPTWSRTRSELLYATPDQRIMIVPYRIVGSSFRTEPPRPWPGARFVLRGPVTNRSYDLHPDGQRIALARPADPETAEQAKGVLVFGFFGELQRALAAAAP